MFSSDASLPTKVLRRFSRFGKSLLKADNKFSSHAEESRFVGVVFFNKFKAMQINWSLKLAGRVFKLPSSLMIFPVEVANVG